MPPTPIRNEPIEAATGTRGFGRSRRLRRPAEFAAVLAASRSHSLRAARQWLSMTAAWSSSATPAVRFGATVGKRNARRSVDRALVKRILREAGRHAAPALEVACAQRGLRVDIAFRLKARRDRATPAALSLTLWRRALREEADALLGRLLQHLAGLEG